MSRKPAKKQAKIIDVPDVSNEELISDLEQQLKKMKVDQKEKIASGIENFFNMISTTAEKYRTVTGMVVVIQDYNNLFSYDEAITECPENLITIACDVANDVADELTSVSDVEHIDNVEELLTIVDDFYHHEFTKTNTWTLNIVLKEMQHIKICQQLGPIVDSLIEFEERTYEEIEKTEQRLVELREKEAGKELSDEEEAQIKRIKALEKKLDTPVEHIN